MSRHVGHSLWPVDLLEKNKQNSQLIKKDISLPRGSNAFHWFAAYQTGSRRSLKLLKCDLLFVEKHFQQMRSYKQKVNISTTRTWATRFRSAVICTSSTIRRTCVWTLVSPLYPDVLRSMSARTLRSRLEWNRYQFPTKFSAGYTTIQVIYSNRYRILALWNTTRTSTQLHLQVTLVDFI